MKPADGHAGYHLMAIPITKTLNFRCRDRYLATDMFGTWQYDRGIVYLDKCDYQGV